MRFSRRAENLLRAGVWVTLAFIYVPLLIIGIYAFNSSSTLDWPPPGFTLEWFDKAFGNPGARDAF
jgi:putative spermidine/putrescine transport system permease protein